MKTRLLLTVASTVLHLLASPSQADEILVYKSTSPRSWNQYGALELANGIDLPKTALAGKYNVTEWWIFNRTISEMQRIEYFTQLEGGVKQKFYRIYSTEPVGNASNPQLDTPEQMSQMFISLRKPKCFFHSILQGYSNNNAGYEGSASYQSNETLNVTGEAGPLVISSALTIEKVARKLKGPYNFSYDSFFETSVPAVGTNRELVFEQGTTTATLDLKKTKSVNTATTGIAPYWSSEIVAPGSTYFTRTLIENELYALGYNIDTAGLVE
jgi:hypothetical protein